MLEYPPFSRLARLLARGRRVDTVAKTLGEIAAGLRDTIARSNLAVSLLGPAEAPLQKIGGNYRHHVILKTRDMDAMRTLIRSAKSHVIPRDVYLEIDIDPYDLM
jgi:primosomal protein N' (replication factor Y)